MTNPFRRNTISIYRFPQDTAIDSNNWSFLNFNTANLILGPIPADIQQKNILSRIPADLPGDVVHGQSWRIFFNAPQNTIKKWDFIEDEAGNRYQITSPYWTVFQYQCDCELLQT